MKNDSGTGACACCPLFATQTQVRVRVVLCSHCSRPFCVTSCSISLPAFDGLLDSSLLAA